MIYHEFSAFPKLTLTLISINKLHFLNPINAKQMKTFKTSTNYFIGIISAIIAIIGFFDVTSTPESFDVKDNLSVALVLFIGFSIYWHFLWNCLGIAFYSIVFVFEAFLVRMTGNLKIVGGNVQEIYFMWFKTHEYLTGSLGFFLIGNIVLMFFNVVMCLFVFYACLTGFNTEFLRWIGATSGVVLLILLETGEYLLCCVSILFDPLLNLRAGLGWDKKMAWES